MAWCSRTFIIREHVEEGVIERGQAQPLRAYEIDNELTGSFITTYVWLARIIGVFVQRQHIFHMPHELTRHFPDAPALD
jgi:hypothetical protein